jgi:tetratricopeptide (TPR) repeat protein
LFNLAVDFIELPILLNCLTGLPMLFPQVSLGGAVWLEMARIHFHGRRYRSTWLALRQTLMANPACIEAWHLAGVLFQQVGQDAAALLAYDRVLRLDPTDCFSWYGRGQVLERMGDQPGAISSYGAAAALCPAYQDVQRRRDRLIRVPVGESSRSW